MRFCATLRYARFLVALDSLMRNQRGFSLINTLMAIALSAVGAGVIASVQVSIGRSMAAIKVQSDMLSIESDILRITNDENLCADAFWTGPSKANYGGASIPLDSIKIRTSSILDVGTIRSNSIRVDQIQLISKDSVGSSVGTFRRWDVDLEIRFSDLSKTPNPVIVKNFPISLVTNSIGATIVSCGEKKDAVSTNDSLGYGCDMLTSTGLSRVIYDRTVGGIPYKVLYYAGYSNAMIHDGGRSRRRDSAAFYCVKPASSPDRAGYISACLSGEACLWR